MFCFCSNIKNALGLPKNVYRWRDYWSPLRTLMRPKLDCLIRKAPSENRVSTYAVSTETDRKSQGVHLCSKADFAARQGRVSTYAVWQLQTLRCVVLPKYLKTIQAQGDVTQ